MGAQVIDLLADPRGRRYTEADREGAYLLWRANRSYRKTAEVLNMSSSTVGSWSQEDAWIARSAKEDAEDVRSMRRSVSALVVGDMTKNIEVAQEIRDNKAAKDRDRLDAAQWLAGLAGVAAVTKVETAVVYTPDADTEADHEPARSLIGLPPDELMRLEEAERGRKRG